ncbi:MAG TPA: restriction endonuclease subunit S, partial [Terriglobia bacterium]|nr:restriction endonuclease subunit S [Terriglobia bacterium]
MATVAEKKPDPVQGHLANGYKQTDIGIFPWEWEIIEIGDLNPYVTSGSRGWAKYYSGIGSPFIRITNLSRASIYLNFGDLKQVALPPGESEGTRTQLKDGDVLISITADIGIIGYVTARMEKPAYINQHIALVRLDSSRSDSRFISYFLASENSQKLFRGWTDQGAKAGMSLETVRKVRLARPSLTEQHAIAEALSDADALIESLEQLIAKKRQIKQGAMQELLTGKKRLPSFSTLRWVTCELGDLPADWRIEEIGSIAQVKTGPFGSSLHERDYVDDGIPIITVEHLDESGIIHMKWPMVSEGDRRRLSAYSLEEGDIVFSRVGSVDRNARVTTEESGWLFSGRLLRLRASPTTVDTRYLSYQFHSAPFKQRVRKVAVGQTMASLNTQILSNVLIVLPPLSEQTAIAAILSDMDAEIAVLEAKHAKARMIRQGMMQELLTGRIRFPLHFAKSDSALPKQQRADKHSTHFNEAVVLALVVHCFGSEEHPLGRFRRTKFSYLLHRHVEHEAPGFLKKAARPYNPTVRYGGAEKIALNRGYVCERKSERANGF